MPNDSINSDHTAIIQVDSEQQHLHLITYQFEVIEGLDKGKVLVLDKDHMRIGTHEDNSLAVNDPKVSRHHFEIKLDARGVLIADLASTNGTFLNGLRINEAFLASNSVVSLGDTTLRFSKHDEIVTPSPANRFEGLLGDSVEMREVFHMLEKLAPTDVTVLIEGETGTGKELVARAIHQHSQRKDKPFVVIDCSATPPNLIESELFGHEKGAFTGAIRQRKGLFREAHGGTIFLDELGELDLELQPKLLRVLERSELKPVGGSNTIEVDVRVIAATNRRLEEEVNQGKFREDLFFRLAVARILLPPLRERAVDIPTLVKGFLDRINRKLSVQQGRNIRGVEADAMEVMMKYEWPGNVRELLNVIERATSFAETDKIQSIHLPKQVLGLSSPFRRASDQVMHLPFKQAKEQIVGDFERAYLERLLRNNNSNGSKAARQAQLDRKYLRSLLQKHGLKDSE